MIRSLLADPRLFVRGGSPLTVFIRATALVAMYTLAALIGAVAAYIILRPQNLILIAGSAAGAGLFYAAWRSPIGLSGPVFKGVCFGFIVHFIVVDAQLLESVGGYGGVLLLLLALAVAFGDDIVNLFQIRRRQSSDRLRRYGGFVPSVRNPYGAADSHHGWRVLMSRLRLAPSLLALPVAMFATAVWLVIDVRRESVASVTVAITAALAGIAAVGVIAHRDVIRSEKDDIGALMDEDQRE